MAITKKGDLAELAFGKETNLFMGRVSKSLTSLAKINMHPDGTTDDWESFLDTFVAKEKQFSKQYSQLSNVALDQIGAADGLKSVDNDFDFSGFDTDKAKLDASIRGVYNLQTKFRRNGGLLEDSDYNATINNMVNGALHNTLDNARVVQRQWIDKSKAGTRTRYGRQSVGTKTCPFCLMLISRGPVYINKSTASFRTHPKCDCTFVPAGEGWSMNDQQWKQADDFYRTWHKGNPQGLPMGKSPDDIRLESDTLFREEMRRQGYVEDYYTKTSETFYNEDGSKRRTYGKPELRERLNKKYWDDMNAGKLPIQETLRKYKPRETKPIGFGESSTLIAAHRKLIEEYNRRYG